MKFKFNKNLDYQIDAINSVVSVFDNGENESVSLAFSRTFSRTNNGFFGQTGKVIFNPMKKDEQLWFENLKRIQQKNNIKDTSNSLGNDFSVEMETGTGKTYIYLRTILELARKYKLKKFIILVPSVAIREGVLKTLEQTKEHFKELFSEINFGYFAYNSDKLSEVREFAWSFDVTIMIMTIQSFNKDNAILNQTDRDDTYGEESYLSLIAQTRPVIVMDEPQNMETDLAKFSIEKLRPIFKLKYSATHKKLTNLLYRLSPVDAYRRSLVKKIEVYGVTDENPNDFVFDVLEISGRRGQNPTAKVSLEFKNADDTFGQREITLKWKDDLFVKTKNPKYKDLIVADIDLKNNRVELSNGKYYFINQKSENIEEIYRTQIKETIKTHFDKQVDFGDKIKVLSLFFINKVDNYIKEDSLFRKMFEEEFLNLRENYKQFKTVDPKNVHKGYFASRKYKGEIIYEDTNGKNEKNDKEAYDLIMKNKEKLLSFDEKVSFIFSHSALKEGWDNPNIFQICTLRDDTANQMKKRQEIGRGLRICLDVNGDRVMEEDKNILTVISNSSYQKYASSLQEEFREDGYKDEDKIEIRDKKRKRIKVSKTELLKMADFLELWKRISKKTRWSIEILPNLLVEKVVEELEKINSERSFVNIERGQIYFDNQGDVKTVRENTAIGYGIKKKFVIENFIERLIEETGMTRKTIFDILRKVSNKSFILENPEHYIRNFSAIVKYKLKNIMLNNGLKYSETGEFWQIENIFKEFEAFPERLLESKRSVFDYVEFDSFGEKKFAESLEILSGVKVYTKLPRGFVVDTPIGKYIPDWAIVLEVRGEEKLYLVRETKFDYERIEDITESEREKINCAKKHFEAIGFSGENGNFKLVQDKELGDLV